MSNKRKKDARISSVELKSLGLEDEGKSEKKKEKKTPAVPAASKKGSDLKQSKISDFVEPPKESAGNVDVSFDGRLESFSWEEVALLSSFLQVKTSLSKQQLALAVELWNTNPAPDCFQFFVGENEGRAASLADLRVPQSAVEHIMFRETKKLFSGTAVAAAPVAVSAPPADPPRQHKKK